MKALITIAVLILGTVGFIAWQQHSELARQESDRHERAYDDCKANAEANGSASEYQACRDIYRGFQQPNKAEEAQANLKNCVALARGNQKLVAVCQDSYPIP